MYQKTNSYLPTRVRKEVVAHDDINSLISRAEEAARSLVGANNVPPRYSTNGEGDLDVIAQAIMLRSPLFYELVECGAFQQDMSRLCEATTQADRILQFSSVTSFIKDGLNLVTHFRAAVETLSDFGSTEEVMDLIKVSIPQVSSYREYLANSVVLSCSINQILEKTGLIVIRENLADQISPCFDSTRRLTTEIADLVIGCGEKSACSLPLAEFNLPKSSCR